MKLSQTHLYFVAALSVLIQGCSPAGDSLFSDRRLDSGSTVLNTEPYQSELSIQSSKVTVTSNHLVASEFVEISGTCYTSTYPQHRIVVERIVSGGATGSVVDSYDLLDATSAMNNSKCVNGRFHLAVKITNFTVGTTTQVRLILQALDSSNKTVINEFNGVHKVGIAKAK